jgi:hypothetical protein
MRTNELVNFCNAYKEYTEGDEYAYNITREYLVFWYNNGRVLDLVEMMSDLGYSIDYITETLRELN